MSHVFVVRVSKGDSTGLLFEENEKKMEMKENEGKQEKQGKAGKTGKTTNSSE